MRKWDGLPVCKEGIQYSVISINLVLLGEVPVSLAAGPLGAGLYASPSAHPWEVVEEGEGHLLGEVVQVVQVQTLKSQFIH